MSLEDNAGWNVDGKREIIGKLIKTFNPNNGDYLENIANSEIYQSLAMINLGLKIDTKDTKKQKYDLLFTGEIPFYTKKFNIKLFGLKFNLFGIEYLIDRSNVNCYKTRVSVFARDPFDVLD